MTVILPRRVAFALARSAGCKIGNTILGEIWVDVPGEQKGRVYTLHLNRGPKHLVLHPIANLERDLVEFAEMTLGITITKTPLTETQQRAVDSLKEG
jgi:hypothetical protein